MDFFLAALKASPYVMLVILIMGAWAPADRWWDRFKLQWHSATETCFDIFDDFVDEYGPLVHPE